MASYVALAAIAISLAAADGVKVSREPASLATGISYASLKDDSLIRSAGAEKGLIVQRSQDGGRTWQDGPVLATSENLDGDRRKGVSFETFYLDPDNGLLAAFFAEQIESTKSGEILYANAVGMGPRTRRLYYRVSADAGRTWGPRQQIIEKGDGYNAEHWTRDAAFGKSTLCMEGRRFHKFKDGMILVPCYLWPSDERIKQVFEAEKRPDELKGDASYYIHAVCLFARWRPDAGGFEWESGGELLLPGGYTPAGTCGSDEPTIAVLDDGRLFVIVRTSTGATSEFKKRDIPVLRYCAVSDDRGKTWRDVRPLAYSDGGTLYSPSSYSELIRSSKNGKWYWIANILPKPTYGGCDPRHPLQIAELDTRALGIKREAITIVEDKSAEDPDLVRFSNFRVYEDRKTKDFLLLMTKGYSELQPGYGKLPSPTYLYRIQVP